MANYCRDCKWFDQYEDDLKHGTCMLAEADHKDGPMKAFGNDLNAGLQVMATFSCAAFEEQMTYEKWSLKNEVLVLGEQGQRIWDAAQKEQRELMIDVGPHSSIWRRARKNDSD